MTSPRHGGYLQDSCANNPYHHDANPYRLKVADYAVARDAEMVTPAEHPFTRDPMEHYLSAVDCMEVHLQAHGQPKGKNVLENRIVEGGSIGELRGKIQDIKKIECSRTKTIKELPLKATFHR